MLLRPEPEDEGNKPHAGGGGQGIETTAQYIPCGLKGHVNLHAQRICIDII